MIHIGNEIKTIFEQQSKTCTPAWLADTLGYGRGNLYRIFHKDTIDTGLLMKLSVALGHNFFADLAAEAEEQLSGVRSQVSDAAGGKKASGVRSQVSGAAGGKVSGVRSQVSGAAGGKKTTGRKPRKSTTTNTPTPETPT